MFPRTTAAAELIESSGPGLDVLRTLRKDLPTIVVEFVSEGKRNRLRDYHEKRAEYLAAGVREYWIIDRFARTLTACRSDSPEVVVPQDRVYQTPLLPGFDLPLARLLAVADRWTASKES